MNQAKHKIRQALEDSSHLIHDSWEDLCRNIVIVIFIGIFTWAITRGLLAIILFCLKQIFSLITNDTELLKNLVIPSEFIFLTILVSCAVLRAYLLKLEHWRQEVGDGIGNTLVNLYSSEIITENNINAKCLERYKSSTISSAIRRCIMTILTIGPGGSGGIEGPIITIGESIGAGCSRVFKIMSYYNMRIFQISGISAAVATLLNCPFTGAIFAVEIAFGDRFMYRPVFFALIGCLVTFLLNGITGYTGPFIDVVPHIGSYSAIEFLAVGIVAIVCSGPTGLCLKYFINFLQKLTSELSPVSLSILGSIILWVVTLSCWHIFDIQPMYVIGMGKSALMELFAADKQQYVIPLLLLIVVVKIFLVAWTLVAHGSSGLLLPAMYIGSIVGATVYYVMSFLDLPIHDYTLHLFVIAGLACSLVSIIEVPLAAIIFVMESFGPSFTPPIIFSCVISHLLVRRFKLYKMLQ